MRIQPVAFAPSRRNVLAHGIAGLPIVSIATLVLASPAWAQSSPNRENATAALEEIIVTAQKRTERLVEVPISISVLTGESLDRSSITSVQEALRAVPGVAVIAASGGTVGGSMV